MTIFEKFHVASLVALAWDRKEYRTVTSAEAWDMGYDVEGSMLIWQGNDVVDCTAISDVENPTEVTVGAGAGPNYQVIVLDLETGEIRND